jgi:hypothetical protein
MPLLESLKTFYHRSLEKIADMPPGKGGAPADPALLEQRIAQLEDEFQQAMTSSPPNVSRSSSILSELGKLWNAKLKDEEEHFAGQGNPADWNGLGESVALVVSVAMQKMSRARDRDELRQVFSQGVREMIRLLEE